jgi:hypothetical protein
MTEDNKAKKWAAILLLVGFAVALDQFIHWGTWFTIGDLHHETFITALWFGGLCLLAYVYRKRLFKGQ